jgi:hypothetical protein
MKRPRAQQLEDIEPIANVENQNNGNQMPACSRGRSVFVLAVLAVAALAVLRHLPSTKTRELVEEASHAVEEPWNPVNPQAGLTRTTCTQLGVAGSVVGGELEESRQVDRGERKEWKPPVVVSHRGALSGYRSGSQLAISRLQALGMCRFDLDVTLTADGHYVIGHPADLQAYGSLHVCT